MKIVPLFIPLSTAMLLYWTAPYLLVVNSVPGYAPPDAATLKQVVSATALARPEPDGPVTLAALEHRAAEPIGRWKTHAKVSEPRAMLARLALGRDIAAVNRELQAAAPWSVAGSSWALNKGDYDFTLVTLTALLYLFGDAPETLYPDTVQHMCDVLLVEEGGEPQLYVPKTLGRVFDTENHVLMTETSRYLTNQWLRRHGSDDPAHHNAENGLQDWMAAYLNYLRLHGFHEFNSVPYASFALQALLNMEAFADPPELAALARAVLDLEARRYALASLDFRQVVPFRRRHNYGDDSRLYVNELNSMMAVWAEQPPRRMGSHGAVIAAALPYRPPQRVLDWVRAKPGEYFARVGHGRDASPELYSGGPGFVLSAGGACPGALSSVMVRPTTLLLRDGAKALRDCIRIPGKGPKTGWNNTGVHHRFACGPRPVLVPERFSPACEQGGWHIYALPNPGGGRLFAGVFNEADFGLLALFPGYDGAPGELAADLQRANPDPNTLQARFAWPEGGTLCYDVAAPYGQWVVTHIDGQPAVRDYADWPVLDIDGPASSARVRHARAAAS